MSDIDDLAPLTAPKSDQINADDLVHGPMDVTVERVVAGPAEQPIEIRLAECKPYRPCKTMARVLSAAWGRRPSEWPSPARLRLYRDPGVTFGGVAVGGIRISHVSGITKRVEVALTVTRSKRALYYVDPLDTAPPLTAPDPLAEVLGDIPEEACMAYCDAMDGWARPTTPAFRAELAEYLRTPDGARHLAAMRGGG